MGCPMTISEVMMSRTRSVRAQFGLEIFLHWPSNLWNIGYR